MFIPAQAEHSPQTSCFALNFLNKKDYEQKDSHRHTRDGMLHVHPKGECTGLSSHPKNV